MRTASSRELAERDQLIAMHGSNAEEIRQELDDQFKTLHGRAQVLLGICGVLLTSSVLITTGRIIGRGTLALARIAGWLLAFAGLCDITATAIIVGGVLHIRWLARAPDEDLRTWLIRAIAHRDAKTRAYHLALVVTMMSMALYQAAVLIVIFQL